MIGVGPNIGIGPMRSSGSGYWTQLLPRKLIVTPANCVEEMDATTGWSGDYDTLEVNNTQFYSGAGSLKVTSAAGIDTTIKKDVNWDLSVDSGKSLRLFVYPHTAPISVTFMYFRIKLCNNAGETIYRSCEFSSYYLQQNRWNILLGSGYTGWTDVGGPTWTNIVRVSIFCGSVAEQVHQISYDLFSGNPVIKPAILITFDDGFISNYTKAYPLLKAKKMVATTYTVSSLIGGDNRLTSAMCQELNAYGWDIGNHTKTHVDLTTLSQAQAEAELNDCKTVLGGMGLTRASAHVSYPFIKRNAVTDAAMLAQGMKTGRFVKVGVGGENYSYYDINWPYEINCSACLNTSTLADMKAIIDEHMLRRIQCCLLFHDLVDANADTDTKWLTSQFSDLLDYIESLGLQTLTIDEYYRLYSGPITVHHK